MPVRAPLPEAPLSCWYSELRLIDGETSAALKFYLVCVGLNLTDCDHANTSRLLVDQVASVGLVSVWLGARVHPTTPLLPGKWSGSP